MFPASHSDALISIHRPATTWIPHVRVSLRASLRANHLQIARNALHQLIYSPQRLNGNLDKFIIMRGRKFAIEVLLTLNKLSSNGERVGGNSWLALMLGVIGIILSAIAAGYKLNINHI